MTVLDPSTAPSGSHAPTPASITNIGLGRINPVIPGPLKDKLGTGGFGIVYRDPRNPARRCVKKYKNVAVGEEAERLTRLASIDQWARPSDAELIKEAFAWPLEVFGEVGRIEAFTMDIAPDDAHFELRMKNGNSYHRLLQLDYLIDATYFSSNAIDSSSAVVFSLQDRVELAINICDSILALHRYGLVYQDISSKNIVARRGDPRQCFILDADSITTPEGALAAPITSPTWEVPKGLDPINIDRARLGLMVLRLLVQGHSIRPDAGCPELTKRGYGDLANAVDSTYTKGDEASATEMVRLLRQMRDDAHARAAFHRAVKSGYARRIVQDGQMVTSVPDLQTVSLARLHVDRENRLEQSDVQTQRRELQALRNHSQFTIDLMSGVGVMPLPTTDSELNELAFDGYFSDIVAHLIKPGLPHLRRNPLLHSVVDRAIVEASSGKITSMVATGKGTLVVDWPTTEFVTIAEVSLLVGGTEQSREVVTRSPAELQIRREIRSEAGGTVTAHVRFGIKTADDEIILQKFIALVTDVVIPPVPQPVAPQRKGGGVPLIDLFDPVEEERLADLARIAREKKLKRQILAAVASVVVMIGGFFLWSKLTAEDPPYRSFRELESPPVSWTPRTPGSSGQMRQVESPTTTVATTVPPTTTLPVSTTVQPTTTIQNN